MEHANPLQRDGVKALLRSIMNASLGATRQLDAVVPGSGKEHASILNDICAEYLAFHMWTALKRARPRMTAENYRRFSEYALKGLAVLASGCFTGLFDKKAEEEFVEGLQDSFARYEKCGSDAQGGRDPVSGDYPLAVLARRVAELAGQRDDADVTMKAMIAGMESVNVAAVNDRVNAIARST